jgi:hypothetical protein
VTPQATPEKKKTSGCTALAVLVLLGGLAVIIVGVIVENVAPKPPPAPPVATVAAPPPTAAVPYTVVQQWPIPNGGSGRLILVTKENSTKEKLLALGLTLRYDTRFDRHAMVMVYNDARAAGMYKRAFNLAGADARFYDRHYCGVYNRNIVTGMDEFVALKNGAELARVEYH